MGFPRGPWEEVLVDSIQTGKDGQGFSTRNLYKYTVSGDSMPSMRDSPAVH